MTYACPKDSQEPHHAKPKHIIKIPKPYSQKPPNYKTPNPKQKNAQSSTPDVNGLVMLCS